MKFSQPIGRNCYTYVHVLTKRNLYAPMAAKQVDIALSWCAYQWLAMKHSKS